MNRTVALLAVAGFTAGASAQLTTSGTAPTLNVLDGNLSQHRVYQPWELTNSVRSVSAGTADFASAGFGAGGGAFLQSVTGGATPGATSTADAFGRGEVSMIVEVADLGDDGTGVFTTVVTWFAESFDLLGGGNVLEPYLPAGTLLGGQPITDLEFSMGGGNGVNFNSGPDALDITPGIQNVVAFGNTLLTTDGAGGFAGIASGGDFGSGVGTQVTSGTFWGAGGADLAGFNIFGNQYFISYTIPAPAGVALLGLGGMVATRRRR